mmetsp:Transcript_17232/g.22413  ORF Transcript_17232/g.22413 Transcript_17232/m.22413 type:complete len:162 (-) Transcript_17232:620-1105(-)
MSTRENRAWRAEIFRDELLAQGGFKDVYKGRYTGGERKGEYCVSKVFRDGPVYSGDFFASEMDVIKKTQQLIERFNAGEFIDKTIYLNIPQVWEFSVDSEKTLVEPLIDNFEKFNSNTGWRAGGGGWYDCMQALSHFSYHSTGGAFVLCDLQGGIIAMALF